MTICEVQGDDPSAVAALSMALEEELGALGAVAPPGDLRLHRLGPLDRRRARPPRRSAPRAAGAPARGHHRNPRAPAARAQPHRPPRGGARPPLPAPRRRHRRGPRPAPRRRRRSRCAAAGSSPARASARPSRPVGELALTATVNVQAGALDSQVLQSTRLFLVQGLAETIGTACWWALRNLRDPGRGRAVVPAGSPEAVPSGRRPALLVGAAALGVDLRRRPAHRQVGRDGGPAPVLVGPAGRVGVVGVLRDRGRERLGVAHPEARSRCRPRGSSRAGPRRPARRPAPTTRRSAPR